MPALQMSNLPIADCPEYEALRGVGFYGPRSGSFRAIKADLRRADTHELFDLEKFIEQMKAKYGDAFVGWEQLRHKTLFDALIPHYFIKAEHKSYPVDGVGLLRPHRVFIAGSVAIGKEADKYEKTLVEEAGISMKRRAERNDKSPEDKGQPKQAQHQDKKEWQPICTNRRDAQTDNAFLKAVNLRELACLSDIDIEQLQRWERGECAIPAEIRPTILRIVNHMQGFGNIQVSNAIAAAQKSGGPVRHVEIEAERKRELLRVRIGTITPDWWNRLPAADEGAPGCIKYKRGRSILDMALRGDPGTNGPRIDSPMTGPERIIMKMLELEAITPRDRTGVISEDVFKQEQARIKELRSLLARFLNKLKHPSAPEMSLITRAVDAVRDDDRAFFNAQCRKAAALYGHAHGVLEFWQEVRPEWMGRWEPDAETVIAASMPASALPHAKCYVSQAREGVAKPKETGLALVPFDEVIRRCNEADRMEPDNGWGNARRPL